MNARRSAVLAGLIVAILALGFVALLIGQTTLAVAFIGMAVMAGIVGAFVMGMLGATAH